MAGYTPVFDTVFNGTLCGRWPTLAVWLTLLPLADWRGHIDMTPEAIALRTGWPINLLLEGITALCEPDPRSRSKDDDGRRLTLLDERDWGWRVVNIQVYREKASGVDQIADGRNAEKVRRYKAKKRTPEDTGGHRRTPQNTNSDSYANTDSNKNKKKTVAVAPDSVPGLNLEAWNRWFEYRGATKKPIKPPSIEAAMRELAAFGDSQVVVVQHSMANSYQGLFAPKSNGKAASKWE